MIKRVYGLREGLNHIYYKTEAIQQKVFKHLLNCASTPIYLLLDEGIKFLSILFSLSPIIKPMHNEFKQQIIFVSGENCVKIAEIYLRAWKSSENKIKEV